MCTHTIQTLMSIWRDRNYDLVVMCTRVSLSSRVRLMPPRLALFVPGQQRLHEPRCTRIAGFRICANIRKTQICASARVLGVLLGVLYDVMVRMVINRARFIPARTPSTSQHTVPHVIRHIFRYYKYRIMGEYRQGPKHGVLEG